MHKSWCFSSSNKQRMSAEDPKLWDIWWDGLVVILIVWDTIIIMVHVFYFIMIVLMYLLYFILLFLYCLFCFLNLNPSVIEAVNKQFARSDTQCSNKSMLKLNLFGIPVRPTAPQRFIWNSVPFLIPSTETSFLLHIIKLM